MRRTASSFAVLACLAFIVSCGDSSNTLVSPHDTISEQNSSSSENNATQSYSSAGTSEHHSSSASSHLAGSSNAASSSSSAVLAVSSCSAKAPDLQASSSSRSSHRRSSSSTRNPSSSARTPTSSQQNTAAPSSQASGIDLESSSSAIPTSATTDVSLDENGFATVADVYRSLAPDEKAVFIIRHSEREDNVAIETELTANGVKMAQDLGATLQSDEEFSYITSGFVRTNETANNISKGRGEASLPKLITNYDITGNWFLKISADSLAQYATQLNMKGSSVELMGHWAYEGGYPDALYELEPRAEEFMQKVILKNLSKWKRVSPQISRGLPLDKLHCWACHHCRCTEQLALHSRERSGFRRYRLPRHVQKRTWNGES